MLHGVIGFGLAGNKNSMNVNGFYANSTVTAYGMAMVFTLL